ncbi:MAG: FMN-binding protein [Planctomycetota bacterium]|nr:FMN-binding protein [Planctomycetota bacterium]
MSEGTGLGTGPAAEKAAMAIATAGPSLAARLFRYAIVLLIVCGASGASVGWVYAVANPRIAKLKEQALRESLSTAFPGKDLVFQDASPAGDGQPRWTVRDASGAVTGACAIGKARGYAGDIEVLVGVSLDGSIRGIRIMASQETPGLGEKIREVEAKTSLTDIVLGRKPARSAEPDIPWFLKQYIGKRPGDLNLTKGKGPGPDRIDAITGATISSRAVTEAVRQAAESAMGAIRESPAAGSGTGGVSPKGA